MKIKAKEKNQIIILYVVTFIYFLICAFLIGEYCRDDYWFTEFPKSFSSLSDFLQYRYESWSSRIIIEAVIVVLLKMPFSVWRILFAGAFTAIPICISHILDTEDLRARIGVVLLTALFPLSYLNNAGWVATTLNYIFPMLAMLVTLILVANVYKKKKNSIALIIISALLAVFATNQEQVLAMVLGYYLVAIILLGIRDKKVHFSLLPVLLVSIASLIFIFKCPGNAIRSADSIEELLPRFAEWNFLQKIYYGAFHAINYLFFKKASSYTAIFILVSIIAFGKKKAFAKYKILSYAEICLFCIGNGLFRLYHHYVPESEDVIAPTPPAWVDGLDIIIKLISVILFVGLCIIIFSVGNDLQDKLAMCIVFLAGYGSAMILGFSPTIYASSTRIFVFMYFSVAFLAAKVITDNSVYWANKKERGESKNGVAIVNNLLLACCALLVLINVILNIIFAINH